MQNIRFLLRLFSVVFNSLTREHSNYLYTWKTTTQLCEESHFLRKQRNSSMTIISLKKDQVVSSKTDSLLYFGHKKKKINITVLGLVLNFFFYKQSILHNTHHSLILQNLRIFTYKIGITSAIL